MRGLIPPGQSPFNRGDLDPDKNWSFMNRKRTVPFLQFWMGTNQSISQLLGACKDFRLETWV